MPVFIYPEPVDNRGRGRDNSWPGRAMLLNGMRWNVVRWQTTAPSSRLRTAGNKYENSGAWAFAGTTGRRRRAGKGRKRMNEDKKWGMEDHVSSPDTQGALVPRPPPPRRHSPSLDGRCWLGIHRQGWEPKAPGTRMSERLRQQVTQGAQRVCCSPGKDRPAWAGTNLGLRCKWSGRGAGQRAGMFGHREESPTPVRHPDTLPFSQLDQS